MCVVMKEQHLSCYKDQEAYHNNPKETFKGEPPIDLTNCTAEVALDYTKKEHVFRLRCAALFQSSDVPDCPLVATTCSKQLTLGR